MMANDRFEITSDPARCFLRVTMRGNWDVETVEEYRQAVLATVTRMLAAGCASGAFLALVDARETGAQQQAVVAAYKDRLNTDGLSPRRLATLVSSALLKRLVERIAVANQRLFTDEAEALAWLFAPSEPASVTPR